MWGFMMRPGAEEDSTEESRKMEMPWKMRLCIEIKTWVTVLLSLNNTFYFLQRTLRYSGSCSWDNPGLVVCL